MGRTKKIEPKADELSLARLKQIIRDYARNLEEIKAFESGERRIMDFINAHSGETQEEQLLSFEKFYNLRLPTGEKNAMQRYFDAKENVFLLESGFKQVPEGKRKNLAYDYLFMGLSRKEIAEKHKVGYNTVRRAVVEVCNIIGMYIDVFMDWKARSLYL